MEGKTDAKRKMSVLQSVQEAPQEKMQRAEAAGGVKKRTGWEDLAERLKKKKNEGGTKGSVDLDEVAWAMKEMGKSRNEARKRQRR